MTPTEAAARVLASVLADRGMTASELARAAGLSQSTVSNVLSASHAPSVHTLRSIEDALGTAVVTQAAAERARCALQACRRQFVKARPWQRYCRRTCSQRATGTRRSERRRKRIGTELAAVRRDVDRMCTDCVGASLACSQADCPLRPWSPFPLVSARRATT